MYAFKRISRIYHSAKEIPFCDSSRFVIISDCHRGDGSWTDDFVKNRNLYLAALNHYYCNDYIYIELGDGDELWAKNKFSDIKYTHNEVFQLLSRFYKEDRLYLLYGNHDIEKKNKQFVKNNLYYYYSDREKKNIPLFKDVRIHEGLVLRDMSSNGKILMLHGHQADFFNDSLWWLSRFLVRYLWKPLESIGINDPTSASKNHQKEDSVERELIEWVKKENVMLIAGHTHRQVFSEVGEPAYFNDGSCVHPYGITAIEISDGMIMLVKWCVKTRNSGNLFVGREVLEGPRNIKDYFKNESPGV